MPYITPREYEQARVYYTWTHQWNTTTTASNNIWYNWVGADIGTTSATTQLYRVSNTVDTWGSWNVNYGGTGYSSRTAWDSWISDPVQVYSMDDVRQAHGYAAVPSGAAVYTQPRETEEERLAREAHWARIREEQEAARIQRDIEQAAVREKALELLGMVLSKQQMEEYRRTRSFRVRGSHGRRYRVHHGTSGNVRQIIEQPDGGEREVAALCAHPRMYDPEGVTGHGPGYLPTEDCLAAQALVLMTDEEKFIATANLHRGRLQPA